MLPTLDDYEQLIYGLADSHPVIRQSTLVLIRRGPAFAVLIGALEFDGAITLGV